MATIASALVNRPGFRDHHFQSELTNQSRHVAKVKKYDGLDQRDSQHC